MMRRQWFLAVGLLLGLVAGVLVYRSMQVAPVVVAARPLALGDSLTPDALELRNISPAARPSGAFTSVEAAAGTYATGPIPKGQFIVAGQLADSRRAALLAHAVTIPPSHALVAIPVDAVRALGGVLPPSQLVDVLVASPDPAAGPGSPAAVPHHVEILGRGVLLVELRSDRGEPLHVSSDSAGLNRQAAVRIGAAVLAVPAVDVPRYVARIPTGSFVLSQRLDAPSSGRRATGHQGAGDTP